MAGVCSKCGEAPAKDGPRVLAVHAGAGSAVPGLDYAQARIRRETDAEGPPLRASPYQRRRADADHSLNGGCGFYGADA